MDKLYSGWGTGPDGDYVEFRFAEIRNLSRLGSPPNQYYHYEFFDQNTNTWIPVESLEQPEVSAMGMTAQKEDFVDKVRKEVDKMYEDGLKEIDIKLAVLKKYGNTIYVEIFGE